MCLVYMQFRAPHAALKRKDHHKSPNMQLIISYFRGLFKFMKRHLLAMLSKQLNLFVIFISMLRFFYF